jgi:hypothetical protein
VTRLVSASFQIAMFSHEAKPRSLLQLGCGASIFLRPRHIPEPMVPITREGLDQSRLAGFGSI